MKRTGKVFLSIAVVLAVAFSISPALLAEGSAAAGCGSQQTWAAGAGILQVKAKGFVSFQGQGAGVLMIRNVSQTKIKLEGQGKVIHLPEKDALLVVGLKGKVRLIGKEIRAGFHGGTVVFRAEGHGVVALEGVGVFRIHGGPVHPWPVHQMKKFLF